MTTTPESTSILMSRGESGPRRLMNAPAKLIQVARGTTGGAFALTTLALTLLVAIFGPLAAPHDITDVVGIPFTGASGAHPMGTDYLGRDVLSRFLNGGGALILQSLIAPLITLIIGGLIGTLAGSLGGRFDLVTTWLVDVLLSLPSLVLALLVLAGLGTGPWSSLAALTIVLLPGCIRVARAATMDAASAEYVEAALSRGESRLAIAVREILPNTRSVLAADFGVRVCFAALIYAGLAFLGVGQSPPAADWGLMVNENRVGLLTQPLAVVMPSIAIALFTVSATIVADLIARSVGGRTRG